QYLLFYRLLLLLFSQLYLSGRLSLIMALIKAVMSMDAVLGEVMVLCSETHLSVVFFSFFSSDFP
ncbi:hypothetical protein ACPCYX_31900, partial [Pseudomonas fluorescens]|uniref:hypothetical protein n=1 Tax=Pseudomonas fluorescens TaxID=294 RepID=UPI003C2400DC